MNIDLKALSQTPAAINRTAESAELHRPAALFKQPLLTELSLDEIRKRTGIGIYSSLYCN